MKSPENIDFSKLLGFNSVSPQFSDGVDFQDETTGARLGAKVGIEKEPRETAETVENAS